MANYESEEAKKFFELTPEIKEGSCDPTKAMLEYEPSEIYVDYGGSYRNSVTRQIYHPVESWTEEERKDVDEFLKFCSD